MLPGVCDPCLGATHIHALRAEIFMTGENYPSHCKSNFSESADIHMCMRHKSFGILLRPCTSLPRPSRRLSQSFWLEVAKFPYGYFWARKYWQENAWVPLLSFACKFEKSCLGIIKLNEEKGIRRASISDINKFLSTWGIRRRHESTYWFPLAIGGSFMQPLLLAYAPHSC